MNNFSISPTLNKSRVFILQKSELEKRWDPNTYHIERRCIIDSLKKSGHNLEQLKFVSSFKKNIIKKIPENLPYLGLENIESNTGCYIETTEKESISSAIEFKKGQVLFPKLRPYLNKVYFAEFDGVCSTEFHVLDSKKVSNEYLANFLRTNLVVNQTKYLMSGNTLPRLQTEDIESLLIPILSKEEEDKVNALMKKAFIQKQKNEAEAEKLLSSIDDYLLNELGIKLPEPPVNTLKNRMFMTTLQEITGGRFDPKLYSTQSKELIKSLYKTKYNYKTLKSVIVQSCSGDWGNDDKEVFNENEFVRCLVIRATEFDNKFNLNVDGSRAKYRLINKPKYKVLDIQANDFLIEKSGGSENQPVGRIAILTKELTDNYSLGFSNFVHKFRVDESIVNPEFVFNYLKTIHNIKITDVMQSQTNGIRNLILNEYLSLPIPVPPIDKQKEIAEHIAGIRQQAQQLKDKTSELLKKASEEIEWMLLS
jgi:restriction endonuclease S subunit